MRVTFEDVVQSFSEEAAYVSMISNVGEYSPVFSGEEKRILLSSPDILFYSPDFLFYSAGRTSTIRFIGGMTWKLVI